VRLICLLLLVAFASPAAAQPRVAPTFLHRFVPGLPEQPGDLTGPGCRYRPVFGAGDSETRIVKGVARFGEVTMEPGGTCGTVRYPREEQVYVVLEGTARLLSGDEEVPIRRHDFMYLAPTRAHTLSNPSQERARLVVMGFHVPDALPLRVPDRLPIANIDEVPLQVVGNHPPTTLYRLLMGDTGSTRDRIAAGHVLTSLFIMEFAPGGTNQPHHHEREEEIYLLLEGEGEMVAGGGMDGIEGRHPARAGDAYFFRLNATVGFYASRRDTGERARILAVRSRFPF
jgi:mannose-6-phosphate isomerase-like protein (cupin superfamily)